MMPTFPDSPAVREAAIGTYWVQSDAGTLDAFRMYRRHYSARKNKRPKIRQFVGPGEKIVLFGMFHAALFVWRRFIDDSGQQGVNCAIFRNEGPRLSSDLIREAELWAWQRWPGQRLYTSVCPTSTARRRSKRHQPGHCFVMAGWTLCGETASGLVLLERMP